MLFRLRTNLRRHSRAGSCNHRPVGGAVQRVDYWRRSIRRRPKDGGYRRRPQLCASPILAREKPMAAGQWIESHVPARLDRLPWSRWHWLIVISLGATWILDGLEVTLAGALAGILTRRETLGLTDIEIGASASCYLAGA